jgi:lysophospholipase L1-like esterase
MNRRRHRAVISAVVAGLLAACTASVPDAGGDYDDFGGAVDLPGGGQLVIPPASLRGGTDIDVVADDAPVPDEVTEIAEQLASYRVDLTDDDALTGPVTLEVPVPDDVDRSQVLAVHVADDGTMALLPVTVSDTGVTVTVTAFSWVWLGVIRETIGEVAGTIWHGLTADLFADAEAPVCTDEDDARDDGWTITSDDTDTVYWCLGVEEGQRTLTVVNNRRYPMILTYGDGMFVSTPPDLDTTLSDLLSTVTTRGRQVIVGPTESVEFLVAPGNRETFVRTEFDGLGASLNNLWFGLQLAANFLTRFGAAPAATRTEDLLRLVLSAPDCINAVRSLNPGAAIACLDLSLIARAGTLAALGAVAIFTTGLIAFFRNSFAGLLDLIRGRDRYEITIGRGAIDPDVDLGPTVMLVVDTSGSMGDPDAAGTIKIDGARSSLLDFLGALPVGTNLGLRTYPSGSGDCGDGFLRFPVVARNPIDMAALVRGLQPDGGTPTAEALLAAADDLRAVGSTDATIILVSDGESTCGDPCAAATEIENSGIDIQITAVGFQTSAAGTAQLQCIADATGGSYIDAGDTEDLEDILVELTGPALSLRLEHPDRVIADVGVGPDGLVTLEATVTNTSDQTADSVGAFLRFDAGESPGIVSPRRVLGRLDPGASTTASWQFRPPPTLAGTDINFSVVVSAADATDVTGEGTITIVGGNDRSDAGPVLADASVAILGDSYASGEGAGDYLDSNSPTDGCHRSPLTLLAETFEIPDDANLACSGAVTAHIAAPNPSRGVRSQASQLDTLQRTSGPVDAVVLSLGGNDAGFETLATSCLVSLRACDEAIFDGRVPTDATEWADTRIGALPPRLIGAYDEIDAVLNRDDVVEDRGGRAPIIVTAYPRIVPTDQRSACISTSQLDADEIAFVNLFITRLNGAVEGAVTAGRQAGLPVFFVDATEDVMQPDHTVCDGDRAWVRSFESVRLAFDGRDLAALDEAFTLDSRTRTARILLALAADRRQELFHPNADGYQALTRAVIRWSLTDDGLAAADLGPAPPRTGLLVGDADDILGSDGDAAGILQGGGTFSVKAGTNYTVQLDGFAPGAPVELRVESEVFVATVARAGDDGRVEALVALPGGLDDGRHRIIASGPGPEGNRTVVIVLGVSHGRQWLPAVAAAAAGAIAAGLLLLLLAAGIARRRRTA